MDSHLSARDPQLVLNIVNHLKSQGIFDQLRRECLADVDTKPSFQNLRQRVEGYVSKFLSQQTWKPDLNKNQLRDALRKQINDSGMLSIGVEHVVDQVVNPQISRTFLPQIESVVRQYLGLERPIESTVTSEKKEEKKEIVQNSDLNAQDIGQRAFFKVECQATEKTPEVIVTPEIPKTEQEKEGFPTVNPGENVSMPIMEKSSEVLASTESSEYCNNKLKNVDTAVDSAPETAKLSFDIHQSTGDNFKSALVMENTSPVSWTEKNMADVDVKMETSFQDDIKRDMLTVSRNNTLPEMLYDENSASCADSIEGDSKLVINEDSVMSEVNSETADPGTINSENKSMSIKEQDIENQFSVIKKYDNSKLEIAELKLDTTGSKDDSSNTDITQETNKRDTKANVLIRKETDEAKTEMSAKEPHKSQEKGRSPSKHKSSKLSSESKPKQSDSRSSVKHKHGSEQKESNKLHKHASSNKSDSSKSHYKHKSKSAFSKIEEKHKSSSSSSSKSSEKQTKTLESTSSSKVSLDSSYKHGSEKKYKSSKMPSGDHKHKYSSSESKSPKLKSTSKDDSKSGKDSESKLCTKGNDSSKSSSSSEKHKSSESSKSHSKHRSKDVLKHLSSSKPLDKHKQNENRSKSDNKSIKKQESSSSSSKHNIKPSRSEEKPVSENRKKSYDSCQNVSQEQPEKSNSSENSNTCDSVSKDSNKSRGLPKELGQIESSSNLSFSERKTTSSNSNDDGPSEKSITKQQLARKASSGENLESGLDADDRSKKGECESVKSIPRSPESKPNNSQTCEEKDSDISANDTKSCLTIRDNSSNSVNELSNCGTASKKTVESDYSFQGKIKNCDLERNQQKELDMNEQCENTKNSDLTAVCAALPTVPTPRPSENSPQEQEQLSSDLSELPIANVESTHEEDKVDLLKSLVLQKSEDETRNVLDPLTGSSEKEDVNEVEDDRKSDITVSSVHTSDLSSYDDKISLSSSDELEAIELVNPTVKEKKVALKEIKEVAATYLKSRTNSSGRSTPVLPSGDDDTNQSSTKQVLEKPKLETNSSGKQEDDYQHSDDEDGMRGSSRFGRQRKVNPKYASEEFVFSSSWKDTDHQPAAVLPARRITRRSAEENVPGRKRQYSKSSDKSVKEETEAVSEKDEKTSEISFSTDHQSTPEEVSTRSKRKSSSRSSISPDTTKNRAEHQRYNSSDLYKPRPVIGSRRHRNEETSNSEQPQEQTSTDPSGHQKRPRGRPRKRPQTPEPQLASSAKRKR